jgi:multidrug efflux pump subunit AcrB
MKKIIAFFIKNPIWVNSLIVLILMLGAWSYYNLNKAFFPEQEIKQVNVTVAYPGASALEMEQGITIKIEQALKGIQEIEDIETVSSENVAQIFVEGKKDADAEQLLAEVENAINSINSFPVGAEKPTIRRLKSGQMNSTVAWASISSKNADLAELKKLAQEAEDELLNSKIITQIEKIGFPTMEITIEVKEEVLLQYGLSFDEISNAISFKNVDFTAGIIKSDVEELIIRSNSKTTELSELENIVVRTTKDGQRILIKDVAVVNFQESESSFESYYNGLPSILIQVNKTTEQDLTAISVYLKKYAKEFNKKHNDADFNVQFDFNDMVEARIDLLVENGIFGLILVMVALGLFLNLRLSSWVAFGIPFSFLGMYFLGYFYGMTVNLISLFGMIMVVGILVDDGIVIAENIYAHYEKGKTPLQAAIDGTSEVMASVFTSVLTTMVAFGMLLFVEGMEMMREMAFVVLACLAFSLIEAFLILPSHLANEATLKNEVKSPFKGWIGLLLMFAGLGVMYLGTTLFPEEISAALFLFPVALIIVGGVTFFVGYTKSTIEQNVRKVTDGFLNYLRFELFGTVVKRAIRKYYLYVWIPFIFLVVVLAINFSGIIGNVPFPEIKPDQFTIEATYKPGENKKHTKQFLNDAEQVLMKTNEEIISETGDTLLKYFSTNLGYSSTLGEGGLHAGEIRVFLNTGLRTPPDSLLDRVARRIELMQSAQLAQEVIVKPEMSQFGAPINFIIKGKDNKELKEAKTYIINEMRKMEGLKNVKDKQSMGRNEIQIKLKPEAEIYQISAQEITKQIRQGFYGQEAQRVIIGTDEVKIWVRYPKENRKSWSDFENMKIKTAQGLQIPISQLCTYEVTRGVDNIYRFNGEREVEIDADVYDADKVGDLNETIQNDILSKAKTLYPGVVFEQQGQMEANAKTMNSVMIMIGIAVSIMIIILTLNFSSIYQAFLIVLVIPVGYAGAVLGHGIVGIPFSALSVFGVLALIGVLVNDAVVFLDTYNRYIKEGGTVYKSAYKAAISRFRPILLTSITTVAGLLPLIAEKDFQAQFLIPMAVTIAFGILFGTFFILICYPAAILFGTLVRKAWFKMWHGGDWLTMKQAEPAYRNMMKKRAISELPEVVALDNSITNEQDNS